MAITGEDYGCVVTRSLTIPPGSTASANPVFVATINDGLEELTETFSVRLENEREAVLGNPQVLEVSIQDGDDPILEPVPDFLMARAGAMLQNLPRLIPMLRDPGHAKLSNLSLEAREGGETRIQGEFRQGGFWADVNASWTGLRSGEHRLALGAIGFHGQPSDNFILGGMMQFDATRTEIANSGGWVEGTGWMFGPYFAAGGPNQSLYAEGRLLWGQSENEILFRGRHGGPDRRGTFETERILAQGRLEGQIPVAGGSRVIPLADLSHVRERAKSFVDDQGRTVPEQTIRQSQIQLGAELDVPIDMASGALNFRPGVRVVGSNQDGGEFGESRQDVMGRFDLGLDYYLGSSVSLSFDGYYSGIGLGKFSGYGVGLDLQIDF